jgi:hypothetical protein
LAESAEFVESVEFVELVELDIFERLSGMDKSTVGSIDSNGCCLMEGNCVESGGLIVAM